MKKILDEIQTTKEDGPAGGEAAVGDITDYTPWRTSRYSVLILGTPMGSR
ncbi:MAG: hypothetical protein ACK2UM_07275 [Anaerolineales bacterium]|jgi:hypothetical protein